MKLVTQDGRELNISRDLHLSMNAGHRYAKSGYTGSNVTAATFTKEICTLGDGTTYEHGGKLVERYDIIGKYTTRTGADKADKALQDAWNSGADEFIMPQDMGEKSAQEALEDFADANNLTLCSINEVGYRRSDVARNLHIWRTTDEFERRNIIIADEFGSYETSLKKWRNLRRTVA